MNLNLNIKSNSKNSKDENKENKKNDIKGIKVKISEEEKNEKVKKGLDENNNNNNNENEENNNIDRQLSQNSFSTKSSADSASFNKLKSRILEKNQPNIIKYMKYISIFYLTLSLIFNIFK